MMDLRVLKPPPKTYSVSGLRTFTNCHRLHFYTYGLGIVPDKEILAFTIGSAYQSGLIATYVEENPEGGIKIIRDAFDLAVKRQPMGGAEAESLETVRVSTIGMLRGYAKVFLKEDLKRWKFLEFEREFNLKMPHGRMFRGFLDALIQRNRDRTIWVKEDKTTTRIDAYHTRRPILDFQLRGYVFAASRFLQKRPRGVFYCVARKSGLRGRQGESRVSLLKRTTEQYLENPLSFFMRKYIKFPRNTPEVFEREFDSKTSQIEECWHRLKRSGIEAFDQNPDYCFSWGKECPYWILCTKGINDFTISGFKERKGK
jgi:hypothetical protein